MFSDKRYIVFLLSSETSCLCPCHIRKVKFPKTIRHTSEYLTICIVPHNCRRLSRLNAKMKWIHFHNWYIWLLPLTFFYVLVFEYYSLQFALRFAGAPKKWEFLINTLNIIDVLSILPFFVSLFFETDFLSGNNDMLSSISTNSTESVTIKPAVENTKGQLEDLLQIFRIFKLARY